MLRKANFVVNLLIILMFGVGLVAYANNDNNPPHTEHTFEEVFVRTVECSGSLSLSEEVAFMEWQENQQISASVTKNTTEGYDLYQKKCTFPGCNITSGGLLKRNTHTIKKHWSCGAHSGDSLSASFAGGNRPAVYQIYFSISCEICNKQLDCKLKEKIIYLVDHSLISPIVAGDSRTKLGVREECIFNFRPSINATIEYSADAGDINNGHYFAPRRAATDNITAWVDYKQKGYRLTKVKTFSIVEPVGKLIRVVSSDGIIHKVHEQGIASCGFYADVYLIPADVNFYQVEMRERTAPAIIESDSNGYFHVHSKYVRPHADTGGWLPRIEHKLGIGSLMGTDYISGWYDELPYLDGSLTWEIPWVYQFVDAPNVVYSLGTFVHVVTISADGAVSISKGGLSESAALNDPTDLLIPNRP